MRFQIHFAVLALAITTMPSVAGVSAQEASALKTTLTPFGAERAGNKDGTIPAWEGVFDKVPPGYKPGDRRVDPFAADKLLYSVTAANAEQHAAQLTEGTKAMLKKYAATYRLDVYPTRRTAGAPQWVYDETFKNATRASLVPTSSGPGVAGAKGGIPFPIPKGPEEILWNGGLGWKGVTKLTEQQSWQITSEGKPILVAALRVNGQYPFYDLAPDTPEVKKEVIKLRADTTAPALRAGEAIVASVGLNQDDDKTYVYLTGQRRTRKIPRACCDTPSPTSAGLASFDETQVFAGRQDLFDWKLIGKREMLIPYNSNRLMVPTKSLDILGAKHLNPDFVRWELHRVWVIEATVAPGKRHVAARSRYYVDEDSWLPVLAERYDAAGQLWKVLFQIPYALGDLPGVFSQTWGFNDMLSDAWFVTGVMNESKAQMIEIARLPETFFNPDAVASQGSR